LKKFQKIFGVFEKRRIAPRKGGKHHQLSNEKGGENVEPNSREFYKQCAFQKFCNTVLHNEACDTHRELRRHKAKEVTFSDMTLDEARQLHTFDEYFKREAAETVFEKAGKKITPKLLLEAIRTLPEEKRKQTTLDGDKQLVHISLVGLPAAAEIRIGQFHIAAAFFDIYFSWCVFHR